MLHRLQLYRVLQKILSHPLFFELKPIPVKAVLTASIFNKQHTVKKIRLRSPPYFFFKVFKNQYTSQVTRVFS